MSEPTKINKILPSSLTVNGNNKYINTVNSSGARIIPYADGEDIESEALALKLAEDLNDMKSLGYYQILAKNTAHSILLDVLYYTVETDKLGKIRTTKGIYFMAILRIRGIKTKFKKNE